MRRLPLLVAAALVVAVPAAAAATGPTLHFSTFITTDLTLGGVSWTGRQMLYTTENDGTIAVSDAKGANLKTIVQFNQGGEEMRCVTAPAKPAYWPQGIYCHTPDNRILRFELDGSGMTQIATVPSSTNSDGALAFDTVGRFGYALLAATGGSASDGGSVFLVRKTGKVEKVADYAGPGGAENVVVAPAKFGVASGQLLIAIDGDNVNGSGRVLAVDLKGKVQTLASGLGASGGINPIAVVAAAPAKRAAGLPAAGLFLADTNSKKVFFAPAGELKAFTGAVIVGSELNCELWLVRPTANGFETLQTTSDLPNTGCNLEGAEYVP